MHKPIHTHAKPISVLRCESHIVDFSLHVNANSSLGDVNAKSWPADSECTFFQRLNTRTMLRRMQTTTMTKTTPYTFFVTIDYFNDLRPKIETLR